MFSLSTRTAPRAALVAFLLVSAFAIPSRSAMPASQDRATAAELAESTVEKLFPDIAFVDVDGNPGSFEEYRGKILVVSMGSVDCPISNKLRPDLAQLSLDYERSGVRFLLVNTDEKASVDAITNAARSLNSWRQIADPDGRIATALAATTTTETFVFDQRRTLRYRGALTDQYGLGIEHSRPQAAFVRAALDAIQTGERVKTTYTTAPGCALPARASVFSAASYKQDWYGQISRIIGSRCGECHTKGGAAPFPLETYEQVFAKRAMIDFVLQEGTMPPWFASERDHRWANERWISASDKALVRRWIASGAPAGTAADAPLPHSEPTGWLIKNPDRIVELTAQTIPAKGPMPWVWKSLPIKVTEDWWVTEAQILPSVPVAVHHAMLFVKYPHRDPRRRKQALSELSGGAEGFWLSYFPGRPAMQLPRGRAKLIPKGAKITIQIHYNPTGETLVDNTRVGFKFAAARESLKEVRTTALYEFGFTIPPNATAEFVREQALAEDIVLLSAMPHMHMRGKASRVEIIATDGSIEPLLNVPNFDFQWQVAYELRQPRVLRAGTRIRITNWFDNTSANARNPDPSKVLTQGDDSTDEMCMVYFDWEPLGDKIKSKNMATVPFTAQQDWRAVLRRRDAVK